MLVTRRGLISLTALSLVWALLLILIIQKAPALIAGSSTFGSLFGSEKILSLSRWTVPELGAHWALALYLFPLCSVMLSADQTASDKSRGTLKLLSLHTSRSSIFLGRFFGLMLVQGIIITLTLAATLVVVAIRDTAQLADALNHAGYIWINLIVVIMPYTALMALLSLLARSGMQAINYAAILWIGSYIAALWLSNKFPQAVLLKQLLPGAQISALLSHSQWQSFDLLLLPVVQSLAYLALGLIIISRIDL